MIEVGDKLISLDVFEKHFVCDLRGAVPGLEHLALGPFAWTLHISLVYLLFSFVCTGGIHFISAAWPSLPRLLALWIVHMICCIVAVLHFCHVLYAGRSHILYILWCRACFVRGGVKRWNMIFRTFCNFHLWSIL